MKHDVKVYFYSKQTLEDLSKIPKDPKIYEPLVKYSDFMQLARKYSSARESARVANYKLSQIEAAAKKNPPITTTMPLPVPDLFTQGYACAAGVVAQIDGHLAAQELLREGNFDKNDLIEAQCEEYDMDLIFPPEEKAKDED